MAKNYNPSVTRNFAKPVLGGFLGGTSEMAKRIKTYKWSDTRLGDTNTWPQCLQTAVNTILFSPVPIVLLWGKDGLMIYNDAYAVFAGSRHPTLLGSKIAEGWPEVADFNRNIMNKGLRGMALSYKDQPLILNRNNVPEEVWLDLHYSPIMNESGAPAGVMAIVIETTKRVLAELKQKHAEEALMAERKNLHKLLMQAPAIIAVVNGPEHVYTLVNPLYSQLTGERPLLGKPIRKARPELKSQGIFGLLDTVYKTGKPYKGKEVAIAVGQKGKGNTNNGFYNFIYQPYRDSHNNIEGIIIYAVDVTEQVNSRNKIGEIADLNRIITDNATTGLMIMDENFHFTFMNPAAEVITGYTLEQIHKAKKSLHDVIHHSKPDGSNHNSKDCPIYDTLSKGRRLAGEDTFVRQDGTHYPVHFVSSPILRDGLAVGAIIEIRNITEEKNAQREQERLVSITNQRNELIKLNTAKDEFIALASHQLRTPATAVKQYISLLLNGYAGTIPDNQARFLTTAYSSNERQLNIINDLLKTAQLDSSRFTLKKDLCNLSPILLEIIEDMQAALAIKKQLVSFDTKDNDAKATIDRNEIKLAFLNLLENASKYSYPNSTIIFKLEKKGSQAVFEISDDGVGISSENQSNIFDKFTRIDNELSDTVTGSGLGLYWEEG